MIETDKRKAVFLLHQEGMSVREITRRLGLSRNTVRAIIAGKGVMPVRPRRDKQQIDPQLLRSLHEQCRGRIQRMHEKLVEEEGVDLVIHLNHCSFREALDWLQRHYTLTHQVFGFKPRNSSQT